MSILKLQILFTVKVDLICFTCKCKTYQIYKLADQRLQQIKANSLFESKTKTFQLSGEFVDILKSTHHFSNDQSAPESGVVCECSGVCK